MIEIANDADAAAAGRPDSEIDAANAFESLNVCAELIVSVVVAAFAHEIEIELAEKEGEGVGVVLLVRGAGGEFVLNAVGGGRRAILHSFGERCFKETFWAEFGSFDCGTRIAEADCGGSRTGMKHANDPAAA